MGVGREKWGKTENGFEFVTEILTRIQTGIASVGVDADFSGAARFAQTFVDVLASSKIWA